MSADCVRSTFGTGLSPPGAFVKPCLTGNNDSPIKQYNTTLNSNFGAKKKKESERLDLEDVFGNIANDNLDGDGGIGDWDLDDDDKDVYKGLREVSDEDDKTCLTSYDCSPKEYCNEKGLCVKNKIPRKDPHGNKHRAAAKDDSDSDSDSDVPLADMDSDNESEASDNEASDNEDSDVPLADMDSDSDSDTPLDDMDSDSDSDTPLVDLDSDDDRKVVKSVKRIKRSKKSSKKK